MAVVTSPGMLKPLRHRAWWLGLWWLAVAAVIVVCLAPAPALPPMPRNTDKIQHLLGYFALAAAAVQVFRRGAVLWIVGVGLFAMGVAVEILQGALTQTRAADPSDALANGVGVVLGLATTCTPWRDLLLGWQPPR